MSKKKTDFFSQLTCLLVEIFEFGGFKQTECCLLTVCGGFVDYQRADSGVLVSKKKIEKTVFAIGNLKGKRNVK